MLFGLVLVFIAFAGVLFITHRRSSRRVVPVSVNYFFTRKCNYECGFCFHTAKTSYILPVEDIKRGLTLLRKDGMRKINFAGGEPFLYPKLMATMLAFCKEELKLESVSIITNGSLVTEKFLRESGKHIDILGVSCDSFNEETNIRIGRGTGKHIEKLKELSRLCKKYQIKFKLNTVVNRFNVDEDMNEEVRLLDPFRWKCFQVLIVKGENNSESTLRDATKFCITDEEFQRFCERHASNKSLVPESNDVMKSSYLLLDEYMRFLDKDAELTSGSILDVGVQTALANIKWDQDTFNERGGIFDWTTEKDTGACGAPDTKLEW